MSLVTLPVESRILDDAMPLVRQLDAAHLDELLELALLDDHYNGEQPLSYMAPELIMELGDRLQQVVLHWPDLVTSSVEDRLNVDGFQLGDGAYSEDLWSIWQGNGLDLSSHQAQVDALVMRRSFMIVGQRTAADLDPSSGVGVEVPLITVESPLAMHCILDPRTRRVSSAAKWWTGVGDQGQDESHVTLYTRNATTYLVHRAATNSRPGGWVIDDHNSPGYDEHKLGVVNVVPLINRPRTGSGRREPSLRGSVASKTLGMSELSPILPLSDAACKIATDMMSGAEFHALPRRWATGVDASDFVDRSGNQKSALSRIIGRLWANSDKDVKFGQFPEAQLSNFHETIRLLADLTASIAGLPAHYMGSRADNPSSADAIRSGESRLVTRVERKQRMFGESYEQVLRIALLIRDGRLPEGASAMETKWRDAGTPTVAQAADAVVKKRADRTISQRQAWDDLGYSAAQQARMKAELAQEAEEDARRARLAATPAAPEAPNSGLILPAA
ncbi:phage portal protein [Kineosporia succinea]|uniref:SPP1 Gp6-like portal protein n=1 Tax=Kineosporia succinea TaxID=84632 RepID=A0ABT9P9T9_9ACTN|nr:phage portal protein [Kineosporia succinea]MDP9829462.1 hypothetical protein [Kineosporia succinea]